MTRRWQAAVLAGVVVLAATLESAAQQDGTAELDALGRRAEALRKAGKLTEAIKVAQKRLALARTRFGATHLEMANPMNDLAVLYQATGQYARAEPLFRRSLEISEAKLGKDHLDVAVSLNNLALLYKDLGQYAKAEPLYRRSLVIYEAKQGKDHPDVALSLNNLAGLYYVLGQHAKAEPLFRRSLEIREAKLGKDHPDVAQSLNNLALLYKGLGQYPKAERLYRRSLEIREARLGKDHPDVAAALNSLAALYQDMGQYAKAGPLYRRSLAIREVRLGKDHPAVAETLHNLAALYYFLGAYAKAEPLYRRCLEIKEATLGKDHPSVATTLTNLAALYKDMGSYSKAEPLYRRSLEIREAKLGKDHPDVAAPLHNLARLCEVRGEAAEAGQLIDRARRSARRHIVSVLPVLSDADKAAFFANTDARWAQELALSLGLAHKEDAALSALSASWLLNGKAIGQESLASSTLLARQSADPIVSKLAAQLLAVRRQLARLSVATARPGQEKQRLQQIEELNREEQELAKKLRQAGSTAAPPAWTELGDLRRALPADAVLIDFARFDVFDFKAKSDKESWQPPRYAAWVTPKNGPAAVVDLGEAEKIDEAVKQFRSAMKAASAAILAEGEEKAEKALRQHLDALLKLVLAPLLPRVGTAKRWLVSPDGNLWLVPFEALPVGEGSYAVEKHQISYLTSGRDVLPAVAPKVKVRGPLVLADPDFDLSPKAARAEAKRLLGEAGEEGAPAASGAFRLGKAPRLAGTAAEAKAIAPSLKAYTGIAPHVLTGASALEGVFRRLRNPRVLVVSTHGFFLPDQESPARDDKGKPKAAKRWENPLLRCGLLLAGCNNAARMTGGDDGVLTGLEVLAADLRGCELVVLSACDTGLGEVQSGEGVAGLRQAFQLAGARAVVSTLWQVPDQQSSRLMALFFHNLAGGMNKAQALRAAKIKVIAERREDAAAAHPFFWAAFTLTGQP
jgi:CHAT domain-containing protein/Tfp pilus assembly protein PilF